MNVACDLEAPMQMLTMEKYIAGGSYNNMLQRCGVFIEFLMFWGNKFSFIVLMNYVWTWTKRNPNLTSIVRNSHTFCDAKAYALY